MTMSKTMADHYRAMGYTIYAASDNDEDGDAQAVALGQAIRLRPTLKDWNADLIASQAAPQPANRKLSNHSETTLERDSNKWE